MQLSNPFASGNMLVLIHSMEELKGYNEGQEAWHFAVHGVTKIQT